jgi:hypothetical protein
MSEHDMHSLMPLVMELQKLGFEVVQIDDEDRIYCAVRDPSKVISETRRLLSIIFKLLPPRPAFP